MIHFLEKLHHRVRILVGKNGRPALDRGPPTDKPAEADGVNPRFLIVTHDPVWPPVSGYDMRNWQIARSLCRHGDVTIASTRAPNTEGIVEPGIRVASLAADSSPGAAGKLRRWRTRVEPRIEAGSLGALDRLSAALRPDLTVFAGVGLYGLMRGERTNLGTIVLDMHNVESDLLRQKQRRRGPLGRLSGVFQTLRASRLEKIAIAAVDIVWCCSRLDRDRAIVLHRPPSPLLIVPNGPPSPPDRPAFPEAAAKGRIILYAGHLGYWPNVDAARRLAVRILPLVRRDIPAARLILAGRSPKADVMALGALEGVSVIADPPDMGELLTAAAMTIVPLESGGGTRIKILEAMAHGLPVVATRLAAEGLDLVDGLDYLAGETDLELADAAIALFRDDGLVESLRQRAKTSIETCFGEAAFDGAIDAALRTVGLLRD